MLKEEIIDKLKTHHQTFVSYLDALPEDEFLYAEKGKWTAGQQADHIFRSIKPLGLVLSLPKLVLGIVFGRANRPSKDYDTLVEKYRNKLQEGGKARGRFIPETVQAEQRKALSEKILRTISRLCKQVDRFTEEQLNRYILPHPLLGKLTLREMLYFTIYHVQHHQKNTENNLRTWKHRASDLN
jgi:hypothetical protein